MVQVGVFEKTEKMGIQVCLLFYSFVFDFCLCARTEMRQATPRVRSWKKGDVSQDHVVDLCGLLSHLLGSPVMVPVFGEMCFPDLWGYN